MSITLTKTLSGASYTLHIKTSIMISNYSQTVVDMLMYEDQQCYTDGFYPMLHKQHNITNSTVNSIVMQNYMVNTAIAMQAIETYLVQSDPWYEGGTVVQDAPPSR